METALSKKDWLRILDWPESAVPDVLILRDLSGANGDSDLTRVSFNHVMNVSIPGLGPEIFVGRIDDVKLACAALRDLSGICQTIRIFATLGVTRLIYIGYGCLCHPRIDPGDWLVAVEAVSGGGVVSPSNTADGVIEARLTGSEWSVISRVKNRNIHWARVYTTPICCLGSSVVSGIAPAQECWVCDRKTAWVFAAAQNYNLHRVAVLEAKTPSWQNNDHDVGAIGITNNISRDGELHRLSLDLALAMSRA